MHPLVGVVNCEQTNESCEEEKIILRRFLQEIHFEKVQSRGDAWHAWYCTIVPYEVVYDDRTRYVVWHFETYLLTLRRRGEEETRQDIQNWEMYS
jgi:hypothetical protein